MDENREPAADGGWRWRNVWLLVATWTLLVIGWIIFGTGPEYAVAAVLSLGLLWIVGLIGIGVLTHRLFVQSRSMQLMRESQAFVDGLMEGNPVPMLVIDRDFQVVRANAAAMAYWTDEERSLRGQSCFWLRHRLETPCDEQGETCTLAEVIRTGQTVRMAHTHVRADGEEVVEEIIGIPLFDDSGSVHRVVEICRDVTAETRADEERRAQFRHLEVMNRVEESLREASNPDRLMGIITRELLEIFGCDRSWILSPCDASIESWRVLSEAALPEYRGGQGKIFRMTPEVQEFRRAVLDSPGPVTFDQSTGQVAEESVRRFSVHSQMLMAIRPISGATWEVGLHACSGPRDWTADEMNLFQNICQRASDALASLVLLEELKAAKRGWEESFDAVRDHVAILDRDGIIVRANRAMRECFAADFADLNGQSYLLVYFGSSRPEPDPPCARAVAGQETVMFDDQLPTLEGWQGIACYPRYGTDGEPAGAVLVVRDITQRVNAQQERQEIEERLRHTQKMESLGVLTGGIAHEFNNLLTGIMGNASLALSDLQESSDLREPLARIESTALRAASLCDQMLAYSGGAHYETSPVDLSAVIRSMKGILEVAVSRRVTLDLMLSENLPAIEANAAQLQQVVMNLVRNASEALGEDSGEVTVQTGVRELGEDDLQNGFFGDELRPGSFAFVSVTDTGLGMDAETIGRIFDPFFSTKFVGRGLGLATVIGIVRRLRGAIQVESEPGRGTSLTIFLPSSRQSAVAVSASLPGDRAEEPNGITVLVVDDEEIVRTLACSSLRRHGFNVLLAEDGQQAVDVFSRRNDEIDAVVLDLTMPMLDGEEAFLEMKKVRPDARIILSTGYGEKETIEHLRDLDLAGFLKKPYRPSELIRKIREAVGAER